MILLIFAFFWLVSALHQIEYPIGMTAAANISSDAAKFINELSSLLAILVLPIKSLCMEHLWKSL